MEEPFEDQVFFSPGLRVMHLIHGQQSIIFVFNAVYFWPYE